MTLDEEMFSIGERTQAMEQVGRALEPLLDSDRKGLQSILALWSIIASGEPASKESLDMVLAALPAEAVAYQALSMGNLDLIEALSKDGYPVSQLTDGELAEEDIYFKANPRDEIGVVSRMAFSKSLGGQGVLAALNQMEGGRVACVSLPREGETASWLALALSCALSKDAEMIWKERKDWSVAERAEAALAFLGSTRCDETAEVSTEWHSRWVKRLLSPEVLMHPVPVKQGWARFLQPSNDWRAHNLKEHLTTESQREQNGQSVDIAGVLLRALGLHAGTGQPASLRPVDFLIHAMGRWQQDAPSFYKKLEALRECIQTLDWKGLGEDGFDRPAAMALADTLLSHSSRVHTLSPVVEKALVVAVEMLTPQEQRLWWSMALTAASQHGYWLLAQATQGLFAGRFDQRVGMGVLGTLADRLKEAEPSNRDNASSVPVGRKGRMESSASSISDNQKKAVEHVLQFWQNVGPVLVATSDEEGASYWQGLHQGMLEKCQAWKEGTANDEATYKELTLALSFEGHQVVSRSKMRM